MFRVRTLTAWCAAFLLSYSIAFAAQATAVPGLVVDASGRPVAGAQVRVIDARGRIREFATLADGTFLLTALLPGRYEVFVEQPPLATAHVELTFGAGETPEPLRIAMQIGGLTDTETVAAQAAVERPAFIASTTIAREDLEHAAAFSAGDLLVMSPGVTVVQGNGPRDVSISVRGSNARQTFGIRNIQVFDDGFPVTQPDGLARTDLIDPHAYGAVDVFRGPSSALFGNYALQGAMDFHLRTDVDRAEVGFDAGGFGYRNAYGALAYRGHGFSVSGFGSRVSGEGFTEHTSFATTTANALMTYASGANTFTLKVIDNTTRPGLSIRLSLDQYRQNPFQRGCAAIAPGCATVSVFANGAEGARVALTAEQAGLQRNDRRTIVGARWERTLGGETAWRTQAVFDNRDIDQPTGATSAVGRFPSVNVSTGISRNGEIGPLSAAHSAGAFYNRQTIDSRTVNLMPGGNAALGAVAATVDGSHANVGVRLREELRTGARWTGVLGVGIERTTLEGRNVGYSYTAGLPPRTLETHVRRTLTNIAPEIGARFRAPANVDLRARIAGGYGTPQLGNLFVTPEGVNGLNTTLEPQRNIGIDLGADARLARSFTASVSWFREYYRDELVSQSAGPNLLSFTFNAPRSTHDGIEVSAEMRPAIGALNGFRAQIAYSWNRQRYTEYAERLAAGAQSALLDRAGRTIPGVTPGFLNARVTYDRPAGLLDGLGVSAEINARAAAFADNANLLEIAGYTVVNLNAHYGPKSGRLRRLQLLAELRNATGTIYIASASNITNRLSAATLTDDPSVLPSIGGIYAGSPRTFIFGARIRF